MVKKNSVTMKVAPEGKKLFKELAAELDSNMIKLTQEIGDYKEEIRKLLKKGRR